MDIFKINYENGKEVLDNTPIPRTPRIGSGSLYETILLAMRNERAREAAEEYDTMEEHFDLHDDEDDEDIPLTRYEEAALEMERAMLAVDNPTTERNTASSDSVSASTGNAASNLEAGTTEAASASGEGVSRKTNAQLDEHLSR